MFGQLARPAGPSSLAPRPNTLRPSMGRPPSCSAASLYFWYSSSRRISSSRGSSASSPSSPCRLQRLGVGHQLARLQVGQRRRHHQVLGGDLHRHRLHRLQVRQVLLGDEGDGDLQDVQLVRLAQVQQQIQRPLELGQLDPVGGAGRNVAAVFARGGTRGRAGAWSLIASGPTTARAATDRSGTAPASSPGPSPGGRMNRPSRMMKPHWFRKSITPCIDRGSAQASTAPPSSGGIGSRLKNSSDRFSTTRLLISAIGQRRRPAGRRAAPAPAAPRPATASTRFIAGPAIATSTLPGRLREPAGVVDGVGLHRPPPAQQARPAEDHDGREQQRPDRDRRAGSGSGSAGPAPGATSRPAGSPPRRARTRAPPRTGSGR